MKKGKRFLSTLALVLLLGGAGFLIGFLGWGDSIANSIQSGDGIRVLFSVLLAYLASIVIHELGHLVFGLATGYRFLSFRILSFVLEKQENGTLKCKRRRIPGTLGQCLMTPGEGTSLPFFWYNFGGVFFNIIQLSISFLGWALSITPDGELWWTAMTVLSALFAFGNWFPFKYAQNDGNNYREMKRDPVSREIFVIVLRLAVPISRDRLISELELPLDPLRLSYDKPIQASYKHMHLVKTLYERRFADFAMLIQEAEDYYGTRKEPRANIMKVLFYFARLLKHGSYAVASKDKMTANLIKMIYRDPIVQMIAYYEALLTKNPKTDAIKARFLQACLKAPYQSDSKDVMRLARYLEEAVSNDHLPLAETELPSAVSIPDLDIAVSDGESKNPD